MPDPAPPLRSPQSGTGASGVIDDLRAENANLIATLRRIADYSTDPASRAAALAALTSENSPG